MALRFGASSVEDSRATRTAPRGRPCQQQRCDPSTAQRRSVVRAWRPSSSGSEGRTGVPRATLTHTPTLSSPPPGCYLWQRAAVAVGGLPGRDDGWMRQAGAPGPGAGADRDAHLGREHATTGGCRTSAPAATRGCAGSGDRAGRAPRLRRDRSGPRARPAHRARRGEPSRRAPASGQRARAARSDRRPAGDRRARAGRSSAGRAHRRRAAGIGRPRSPTRLAASRAARGARPRRLGARRKLGVAPPKRTRAATGFPVTALVSESALSIRPSGRRPSPFRPA